MGKDKKPDPDTKIERLNPPLSHALRKSLRQVQWAKHTYKIRAWLKKKRYLPTIMRKYGRENFRFAGSKIFLYDREIIDNEPSRSKIFDATMDNYGGVIRTMRTLHRQYLGISYEDVRKRHKREERRQLKAGRRVPKRKTFIAVDGPGVIQCDTTFYHGHKWPVFGFVDVFSRFGFYVMVKEQTAKEALWAFKICTRAFNSHTKYRIFRVETDAGGEFEGAFAAWLTSHHIHLKSIKQPQRMIESLNKTLRAHVERVDYGRKSELESIIAKFNKQYNNSSHRNLAGQTPLDILAGTHTQMQAEKKRQLKAGRKRMRIGGVAQKPIEVGSFVRIFLGSDKDDFGHRGTAPHWTKAIFIVTRRVGSSRGDYRYKVKPMLPKGASPTPGLFFGDRLQVIEIPTHAAKPAKYDPGREPVPKGDAPRKAGWGPYAGKEDIRASSGEEADGEEADDDHDMDEKRAEPPPTRPQKKQRAIHNVAPRKPPVVSLGSKVRVLYEGKPYMREYGVVLSKYKDHYICLFAKGGGFVKPYGIKHEIHKITRLRVARDRADELVVQNARLIITARRTVDDRIKWRGRLVTVRDDGKDYDGTVLEFYKDKVIVAFGSENPYEISWYDIEKEIVKYRSPRARPEHVQDIINWSTGSIETAKAEIDEP